MDGQHDVQQHKLVANKRYGGPYDQTGEHALWLWLPIRIGHTNVRHTGTWKHQQRGSRNQKSGRYQRLPGDRTERPSWRQQLGSGLKI